MRAILLPFLFFLPKYSEKNALSLSFSIRMSKSSTIFGYSFNLFNASTSDLTLMRSLLLRASWDRDLIEGEEAQAITVTTLNAKT